MGMDAGNIFYINELLCNGVHSTFVLHPFALMPFASSHHFSVFAVALFWFNTLWLAALYYVKRVCLMRISVLIHVLFFRNVNGHKTRAG
jgi:hypothetical protein